MSERTPDENGVVEPRPTADAGDPVYRTDESVLPVGDVTCAGTQRSHAGHRGDTAGRQRPAGVTADGERTLSRRRLLALAGTGAATVLAGCGGTSGADPSGEGSTAGDPGGEPSRSTGTGPSGTGCSFATHAAYAGDLPFSFGFDHPDAWEVGTLLNNDSITSIRIGRPSTALGAAYAHYLEITERHASGPAEDDPSAGNEAMGIEPVDPVDFGGTPAQVAFEATGPREGSNSQGIFTWHVGIPAGESGDVHQVTLASVADGTEAYPACLDAVQAAGEATVRSIRPK